MLKFPSVLTQKTVCLRFMAVKTTIVTSLTPTCLLIADVFNNTLADIFVGMTIFKPTT
jgi:hypothetical protein